MFAAQGLACHAVYAEVVFVELARLHQFVDEAFGRASAGGLGHEAGVGGHGEEVEVGNEAVRCCKGYVREEGVADRS